MAENVGIAIIGLDAEVKGVGPVPLVVDGFDEMHRVSKPELDWPLIGFMAAVTFHAKLHKLY
jgi:hypothetical protein